MCELGGETIRKGGDWGKLNALLCLKRASWFCSSRNVGPRLLDLSKLSGAGNLAFGYKLCLSSVGLNVFRVHMEKKMCRLAVRLPFTVT